MSINSLSLNVATVRLMGEATLNIGQRPYDENLLRELRAEYGVTHVFKRDWESNMIVDIPVSAEAQPLADKVLKTDLSKNRQYWAPLLNAAILRVFDGKRDIISDYPVEVLGNPVGNLIQHEALPDWVRILPLMQFTPKFLHRSGREPNFCLLCDARTRSQILLDGVGLHACGLSLIGRYVSTEFPVRDTRLSERRITVGRVKRVDGDMLILEDHRDGYESIPLRKAYLTADRIDFDWCVTTLIPGQGQQVLDQARQNISEIKSGPGRLALIEKTFSFLRSETLEAVPGIQFEIGRRLATGDNGFPEAEMITKPALVFDPAGTRNDNWNERGIKTHGPYDQRTFSPKRLNIAVVSQARFEGQVDAFMAKFLDGMPNVMTGQKSNRQARYGDGFIRRYKLERPNVQTFISECASVSSYQDACNALLQHAVDAGIKWDLAIVQIEEEFKAFPGPDNPYYGSKAILLRNLVAVQNVRIETIRDADENLVFTMNQISLATYAKLGGRPWLLSAQQNVAHEMVIGLGSYTESTGRFGSGTRHVGITTVFSSDGGYHLSERTGVVPFEKYSEELTRSLLRTIQRVRGDDNWKDTDRVRLIFHMFKPPKDVEAEAIKATVKGLSLSNVTYAFIHIATNHPFVVFDNNQTGLPSWERNPRRKKGVMGPSRGVHLPLGAYESLVVFSGASELKKPTDGLPRACILKLHRNSTFKDMTYLTRQAFDFTAHSWRIMTPEPFPITIKYSDLIAERLSGLKQIESWDDDAIKFRDIGRTPWFL